MVDVKVSSDSCRYEPHLEFGAKEGQWLSRSAVFEDFFESLENMKLWQEHDRRPEMQ